MPDWSSLYAQLREREIRVVSRYAPEPVGGGDISAAWRLRTETGRIFAKTAPAGSLSMFQAEAEGLSELANAQVIRVPQVIAIVECGDECLLALEWLDLQSPTRVTESMLGERLAAQHRVTADQFGWHRDNTIGATPQRNTRSHDWIAFFTEHRIGYQLRLAQENGFGASLQAPGAKLLQYIPRLFDGYQPQASLLHGDLWSGNHAACDGQPVIFDPAVYFGDRETDIAMTRLFGGFDAAFYSAYQLAWPLPPGAEQRTALYQLYHVLNHLNLFGQGYLDRALTLIRSLS